MKKLIGNACFVLFLIWAAAADAQIVGTLPFQLQNGTTADATQVMADFNKILNDVNTNGAKNGVNTDITALNALVTPITPAQGGSSVYFASTSGGTANAQTVAAPAPVGFTLSVGKRVTFIAGFTNTGAMQLNVNGTGLTNVFRPTPAGPVALLGGEVVVGNYIEAVFDGTQYQLYTDATQKGGFGPIATVASAGTTDLGLSGSHNIFVTGTTTITSFGSSALTAYPNYKVRFNGVLTLTHNGTSLLLPGSANITTASLDSLEAQYLGSGNWIVTSYTKFSGAAIAGVVPTTQVFTSGSGTYNRPANVRYLHVRMVGGGGGGGGSGSGGGGAGGGGGVTTFSTFTANGGAGGQGGGTGTNTGGAGGTASSCTINLSGATGGGTTAIPSGQNLGGIGGVSAFFGGNGAPLAGGANPGVTNTGGGGAGGSFASATASGAGGGGGGSCEGWINTPAATYSYGVGAAGAAGTTGTSGNAGGAGGSGYILVEEYY